MALRSKTLLRVPLLSVVGLAPLLAAASCVNPDKEFKAFDTRVIDAGKRNVASGCNGGEIPDVNGEFYLALSPVIAQTALLELIVTTKIDLSVDPAQLSLTFQPLCTQADQCTVGQPIGSPYVHPSVPVTSSCTFEANIESIIIPGGGNTLSGSEIDGKLQILGNLQSKDLYCGIVNGIANVGGAPIPIDNSTFGSIRIAKGTLGTSLPTPVSACPSDAPASDAGVADAGVADAGVADAG